MRCLALLMTLLLTGCARPLQRFEFTRLCMGVQTRIVAYSPEQTRAESAAAAAFERIDRLDAVMSDYRRGSELNRLSDAAGGPPVPVSRDLFDVLLTSQDVALASGGTFDITVGPAVALWRKARSTGRLPEPDQTARALALIGWERLELNRTARTARLTTPGMRLDLGGIAKGFAAEEGVRSLRARGIGRCLVALAGDVFVGDPPPGDPGWRIEIRGEQGSGPTGTLLISNSAVSTSGDTEQFFVLGGRRYSHIIDPRTGLGIPDRRSVTVVAPRGAWADALATPACILGPEASTRMFAAFPGTAALFEQHGEPGPVRTTLDPARVLRWAGVAAPATPR